MPAVAQKKQASKKQKEVPGAAHPIVDEERDLPRERERFLREQRAYPNQHIPAGARLKALQRMEEMQRAERDRSAKGQVAAIEALVAANQLTWTPIGPAGTDTTSFGPASGRVAALAVDLTDPNIVYAGGAQGGVWKSTDGGSTWTPLTDSQVSLAIGSIVIDPSSCSPAPCKTIYVGTGEQVFSGDSYYGAGILKSTDAGSTWTNFPGTISPPVMVTVSTGTITISSFSGAVSSGFSPGGGARIGSLAVKADGSVLLACVQFFVSADGGASSGIYRSTDGGATWTQVKSGAAGTEVLFDPDPSRPNVAYAAMGSPVADADNGVYKSMDGGATWARADASAPANAKLPTTNAGRWELAIAPSLSTTLYAASSNVANFGLLGMFKSSDGGLNWTQLLNTPDYCSAQCDYDHVIRVHPNNPNVVYAGGAAVRVQGGSPFWLVRSTDGGVSWLSIASVSTGAILSVHVDQHAMAFGFTGTNAVRLYLGNDGGVWKADVSASTGSVDWSNVNVGLAITQFYGGASIHPSDEQEGIAGTQDNGTQKFDGSLFWTNVTCGDGGSTAYDYDVPSTVYVTCQLIDIRKSLLGGGRQSYTFADSGINQNDSVSFIPPFIIDPNISQRLYFGTNRLYQTTNGASSWQAISPDLTSNGGVLEAIAVAPSNSDVIYTGSSNGRVFRSLNAGQGAASSWSDVTTSSDLPNRTITQIAVHPSNQDFAFVTFSGFSGTGPAFSDTKGHVFKTINGGSTWADISGPLPNSPVNAIVIDPTPVTGQVGDTLYVGTDVGVFVTTDGGQNWSTLVTGLPRVAVFGLALRQASRTLRASTHGRGLWDLQLPGLPAYSLTAVTPTRINSNSGPQLITVRGNGFLSNSVLLWNGTPPGQTFVDSPTQLHSSIPNSLLVGGPPAQVTVDTTPGPGPTNALLVTVLNLLPRVLSISPTTVASGSGSFTLMVSGFDFVSTSEVHWDGVLRPTTFVSSTQLTAQIPASDTAVSGKFQVTVFSPTPGGGTSSPFTFQVTGPPPANDDFNNAITASPIPFTDSANSGFATSDTGGRLDPVVSPGGCTSGAASGGNANSIWYKFTAPTSGTITADTIGSVYDTLLTVVTGSPGAFAIVACDDDAIAPGGPSRVSFSATAGTTYFFMISAWAGDGGTTVFHLNQILPPANDNISSPTIVLSSPFADAVNTVGASSQAVDPVVSSACSPGAANFGRAKNIWYRFTPTANGTVTADTTNSDYDTILAAFTGVPGAFVEAACNDDISTGLTSQLSFAVTAGTTYYLMISDYNGLGGAAIFHFASTANAGPDFNVSVSSQTITVIRGQPATATLTITPVNGAFTSAITFSCTGLPSLSACSFNPPSVTPGSNPATVTMTITATAPSMIPPAPPFSVPLLLLWLVAALAMLTAAFSSQRTMRRRAARAMAVVGLVILTVLIATCGGGGGGGGSSPPPIINPGTAIGSYSVSVIGTAGGSTQHFATFTLTVQ